MKELQKLWDFIIQRVNINLRELEFDAEPYFTKRIKPENMSKFYAFYGITPDHPLSLVFKNSSLSGSYFLGKCSVSDSLVYKADIRGDELKRQGDSFTFKNFTIPLNEDEVIDISNSVLIKTLVHNYSHDPETPERFFIANTLAMDYANIHGAPTEGSFIGPFATVDLTTVHDCVIGTYSYVQAGEINHLDVAPGTIWINSPGNFDFHYQYDPDLLSIYAGIDAEHAHSGLLFDFMDEHDKAFQRIFDAVNLEEIDSVPESASMDRYAVILPKTSIAENVLVSQRAYLANSSLGKGANAQENCYIINSTLAGFDVTAHGAKLIEADLEKNVFVGFNSFLRGKSDARLHIGEGCAVMPHTIIDISEPLDIPPGSLVWGLIRSRADLEENSMPITEMMEQKGFFEKGRLRFEGDGGLLIQSFSERIHHILDVNGAFFDGKSNTGHAQRNQNLSLNTIQPFQFGEMEGLYPNMTIEL